jgi:hypothetical protein
MSEKDSSCVVELAAPTLNGRKLVQSSGGIWYHDDPNEGLVKVQGHPNGKGPTAMVNTLLTLSGYPTAQQCTPHKGLVGNGNAEQAGTIVDGKPTRIRTWEQGRIRLPKSA